MTETWNKSYCCYKLMGSENTERLTITTTTLLILSKCHFEKHRVTWHREMHYSLLLLFFFMLLMFMSYIWLSTYVNRRFYLFNSKSFIFLKLKRLIPFFMSCISYGNKLKKYISQKTMHFLNIRVYKIDINLRIN